MIGQTHGPYKIQELLGRGVRRCLEKDAERRYETAKGLKFDLEHLGEDAAAPVAAGPKRSARGRATSRASRWAVPLFGEQSPLPGFRAVSRMEL